MRCLLLTIATLSVSTVAFTQSNQSDSRTLQALLEEVRLLRQDLHTHYGYGATCPNRVVPIAASRRRSRACV